MHNENHHRGQRGGRRLALIRARFGEGPEGAFGGRFFGGRGPGFGHRQDGPMGGRRARRFDSEELRSLVLGALAEAPQHGYQLIRAFAEKSGGGWQPSPGVLYPLLTMLAEMGLIAETPGEGARKQFALTPEGEAEVASKSEEIAALNARLAALAELANRTDRAPVRRAVHNLRAAIVERLGRVSGDGGADAELAFEIARLIDEATQKIERIGA